MLPPVTAYGMLMCTEVRHAKTQSISHCAVARRGARANPSCREIYVAVLPGRPRQDDPAGGRRLGQRRDCGDLAYPARNCELVAQALLPGTPGWIRGSGAPRPAPGFF